MTRASMTRASMTRVSLTQTRASMTPLIVLFFYITAATARSACEGKQLRLTCESGSQIDIISANYGRLGKTYCWHTHMSNTNCRSSNSLNVVKAMCQGRSSCSVPATNIVFGDPCGGTYKYLEVDFFCTKGPLKAISATMSSIYGENYPAERCIDGKEDGSGSMCHTRGEKAPWLALDFGAEVTVERVRIHNRDDCCGDRLRNVKVWVADQLPSSGKVKFSGGRLLARFRGPGKNGQVVTLTSRAELAGRFVIIQIYNSPFCLNNPGTGYLNLNEVTVWGKQTGLCGLDANIDPGRLIGEQNAAYIIGALDNTNEDDIGHRTQVFDFAINNKNGKHSLEVKNFPLIVAYSAGLFSVILVPPRSQCNRFTFEDAATIKEGYFPVFIGANFKKEAKEVHNRFMLKVMSLKRFYKNTIPKLCASFTPMSKEHATNRASTMNKIFNLFLNEDREIEINKQKQCPQTKDTLQTISKSEIYDTRADFSFKEQYGNVVQDLGFVKVVIVGTTETKSIIGRVETELGSANSRDIVAKEELFVIDKGSITTSFFVAVKPNNVDIAGRNKTFKVILKNIDSRGRRESGAGKRTHFGTIKKLKPTFDARNCDKVLGDINISRKDVQVGTDNTVLWSTPDPRKTSKNSIEMEIDNFIKQRGNENKKTLEMTVGGKKLKRITEQMGYTDGVGQLWLCLSRWFAEEAKGVIRYFGWNARMKTPYGKPHDGIPAFYNAELPVLVGRKNDPTFSGLVFHVSASLIITNSGSEVEATTQNVKNKNNHINLRKMLWNYFDGNPPRQQFPIPKSMPPTCPSLPKGISSDDDWKTSNKQPIHMNTYVRNMEMFLHTEHPHPTKGSLMDKEDKAAMRIFAQNHYKENSCILPKVGLDKYVDAGLFHDADHANHADYGDFWKSTAQKSVYADEAAVGLTLLLELL